MNAAPKLHYSELPEPAKLELVKHSVEPDFQPFYCSAEYHLMRLTPTALGIHSFALHLSTSGFFSPSVPNLARYFKFSETSIRTGIRDLVKIGFLELDTPGIYSPNIYRVLTHDDWAKKHPGQCAEKVEYVWAGEGDKLAQHLSSRTGFKAKLFTFQMDTIRKTNLPDEVLFAKFDDYYDNYGRHKHVRNVVAGFIVWLQKGQAMEIAR